MRIGAYLIAASFVLAACGGEAEQPAADASADRAAADAGADSSLDVAADAPRVWCSDSTLDGGGMLCAPGMVCGNSGGIMGNCCCYPQQGAPDYYCPC